MIRFLDEQTKFFPNQKEFLVACYPRFATLRALAQGGRMMMFGKLKRCFQKAKKREEALCHPDFHVPLSADVLLNTPERKRVLHKLWENVSLSKSLYQQLYLQPLKMLLTRVQHLPAGIEGKWSVSGGFADLTLQFTLCAVKLARGQLLPPDSPPEVQSAEGTLWQAVIFYSAMCYYLPLLKNIEAELDDGSLWLPGLTAPLKPFRFRFIATNNSNDTQWLAPRLLPDEAIRWLSTAPNALYCLMAQCKGQSSAVSAILIKAAEIVRSPDLTTERSNIQVEGFSVDNSYDSDTASSEHLAGMRSPAAVDAALMPELIQNPDTSPVTDTNNATDTQVLLSLFGDNNPNSDLSKNESAATQPPVSLGQHFLDWLSTSLISQTLPVNVAKAHVHLIGGTVYLCVPAIFHHYLKLTGCEEDRKTLQRAFEKCKCHQVIDGKRFRQGKLYASADRTDTYQRVSGYLIKGGRLYKNHSLPTDSDFLILS